MGVPALITYLSRRFGQFWPPGSQHLRLEAALSYRIGHQNFICDSPVGPLSGIDENETSGDNLGWSSSPPAGPWPWSYYLGGCFLCAPSYSLTARTSITWHADTSPPGRSLPTPVRATMLRSWRACWCPECRIACWQRLASISVCCTGSRKRFRISGVYECLRERGKR